MGLHEIVVVDSAPPVCPSETCNLLPNIIGEAEALQETEVRTVSDISATTGTGAAVIVVRCSLQTAPNFRRLAAGNSSGSIFALFCEGTKGLPHLSAKLLNNVDDFVICPCRRIELIPRLRRLLDLRPLSSVPPSAKRLHHLRFLIGEAKTFLRALSALPRIARSEATVLISGESGTGKELVAREIHYTSPRQDQPFVPVNCGAIPDELFENELFGHTKGAYTGASSSEKGLLSLADQGTLFLDEVDALSPRAQMKLLRFLQNREYRPLGSRESLKADTRVVAATNTCLEKQTQRNEFREDLYYRINILRLELPPLRERLEDIPLLAQHFLNTYAEQYERGEVTLSLRAVPKLLAYSWPGNVRELEALCQRAIVMNSSQTVGSVDLNLSGFTSSAKYSASPHFRDAKRQAVDEFERAYLLNLLTFHHGNITHAARSAGTERRVFQRLVQKHKLDRTSFK